MDDIRSNVKLPTLHKEFVCGPGAGIAGVPELKVHGTIAARVPADILEKSPVVCRTIEKFDWPPWKGCHCVTFVAVAKEVVSYVTIPPKSILP